MGSDPLTANSVHLQYVSSENSDTILCLWCQVLHSFTWGHGTLMRMHDVINCCELYWSEMAFVRKKS